MIVLMKKHYIRLMNLMKNDMKGLLSCSIFSFLFVHLQVSIMEIPCSLYQISIVFSMICLIISILYLFISMTCSNQYCTCIQMLIKDFLYLGIYLALLLIFSFFDAGKTLELWLWVPYPLCATLLLCFFLSQFFISFLMKCYMTIIAFQDILNKTS